MRHEAAAALRVVNSQVEPDVVKHLKKGEMKRLTKGPKKLRGLIGYRPLMRCCELSSFWSVETKRTRSFYDLASCWSVEILSMSVFPNLPTDVAEPLRGPGRAVSARASRPQRARGAAAKTAPGSGGLGMMVVGGWVGGAGQELKCKTLLRFLSLKLAGTLQLRGICPSRFDQTLSHH
jgi:hypothetical protein